MKSKAISKFVTTKPRIHKRDRIELAAGIIRAYVRYYLANGLLSTYDIKQIILEVQRNYGLNQSESVQVLRLVHLREGLLHQGNL